MKCLTCGERQTTRKGSHRYCEADGLDVVLEGVTLTECSCGVGVVIPKLEQLNERLVETMAKKAERLTPGEVRWLRKYLGWSGVDFARRFGVDPATVSRWENGKQAMGTTAELFLRALAVLLEPVAAYPLPDELTTAKRALRMTLAPRAKGWRPVARPA